MKPAHRTQRLLQHKTLHSVQQEGLGMAGPQQLQIPGHPKVPSAWTSSRGGGLRDTCSFPHAMSRPPHFPANQVLNPATHSRPPAPRGGARQFSPCREHAEAGQRPPIQGPQSSTTVCKLQPIMHSYPKEKPGNSSRPGVAYSPRPPPLP